MISHLPSEPPDVIDSIHGPALLTAEETGTQTYMDLSLADWEQIKRVCRRVQPAAQFPS